MRGTIRIVGLCALAALGALCIQAETRTAEKYSFRPVARPGDRFVTTNQIRQTVSATLGKQVLSDTNQTDDRQVESTVIKATIAGRPIEFREKTTRHERQRKMTTADGAAGAGGFTGGGGGGGGGALGGLVGDGGGGGGGAGGGSGTSTGPLEGVELVYRLVNDRYQPSLVAGRKSEEVVTKLKSPRLSVMDEELLPTVPLAVGQSQTITDPACLKASFSEFGPDTKFLRPLTITLESVYQIGNSRIAVLRESTRVETSLPVQAGTDIKMVLDIDYTLAYDLDNQYLRQAKVQTKGKGSMDVYGQKVGMKTTYTADIQTVRR